ncbi:hypothetical protein M501DRAFT_985706 [Patellaria atrata CBS 101060]|uniref:Uncharacterized protein n=1 Tax=Patellaria atrata CBS 101060 TaxID=1346257 RepID=A0A9P4SJD4_9PEZI|nr:hypothetical protein M501DRAFT_985706 [Patellaria atrata CBS 101060]
MTTTPPPPSRIRTPPTPLHGPRYDSYEPYSPRRSSRVAAQRTQHPQTNTIDSSTHYRSPRVVRATTPIRSHKRTATRASNQTFSPPSSPGSPATRTSSRTARKPRMQARLVEHDSDSDAMIGPSGSSRHLTVQSGAMLPTPSKTPRKVNAKTHQAVNATARILFANRPATVEDAMPSPRKARRRHAAFTLSSFVDECDIGSGSDKIQIYTDSKDRVPDVDEAEDNPFVGPKKTLPKKKATTKRDKAAAEADAEMEEAAKNNEGVIYVFRGKKMFRKFEDSNVEEVTTEDEPEPITDFDLRRPRKTTTAHRPFTRSSIAPRLLFPSEDQLREREAAEEEEAVTDIDETLSRSKPRSFTADGADVTEEEAELITPVKQTFRPATPPSTVRATRSRAKKDAVSPVTPVEPVSPMPPIKRTSSGPFDKWQRTKSGKGTKREGDVLEKSGEAAGKRVRSGAYSEL